MPAPGCTCLMPRLAVALREVSLASGVEGPAPSEVEGPGSTRGARSGGAVALPARTPSAALALDERAVLTYQEIEVGAFLVRELQEDLLALGVLELLAVLLEEPMRAALAADADHQRLLVVDPAHQPLGAVGEESLGGVLEEEERRPRLE